jgi:alkylresorcinol/alkylpyrone synthase
MPTDAPACPVIASVGTALAPHRYPQQEITAAFGALVTPHPRDRAMLERFHSATGVQQRYLALALDEYVALDGFGAANDAFLRVGLQVAAEAVERALVATHLDADDVDFVMSTTVTGVAAPGLEARLAPLVGWRDDVRRVPAFGLGCVGGAAGIARVADYLVGHPDQVALLLSVELCSLTVQRDDASPANLVASGLFGDGAAAVVMIGARRAEQLGLEGPVVVDARSRLYPDTERVMGWDIGGSGFRVVLAPTVADVVEEHLGDDVKRFLAGHDLDIEDIRTWVAHPGGPKVLSAMARTLGRSDDDFAITWQSLAEVGNLSSASVLHVLAQTMHERPVGSGDPALLMAMGPGFCSELVLLQW